MSHPPPSHRAKVRAEWLDQATAEAWRKWHDKSVRLWSELTEAMVASAGLERGQRVLDLASGTGDPALTLAGKVGPSGTVTATDLAPQMLEIARENADRAGLRNLSFAVVDAHEIPFADAAFDRVTCRLGVMYFWDLRKALSEIRRVLRPGGRASFIAWGPLEENQYMAAAVGPFKKRRPPEPPAPGAPHPYRFGAPGSLSAELRAAGFSEVEERSTTARMSWAGPPEELWTRIYEVSAPMRPYFDSFPAEVRAEAIREAIANFARHYDGREVVTTATIVVASAVK